MTEQAIQGLHHITLVSIYFQNPDGIITEIATRGPGCAVAVESEGAA